MGHGPPPGIRRGSASAFTAREGVDTGTAMFGWGKRQDVTLAIDNHAPLTPGRNETVLNAALRHGIAFPHSCKVGGCGACKCQLVDGKVRELTDKSYLLSQEEMDAGFILGCQSIPQSDVVLRLPANPLARQKTTGTVIRQVPLTHDISEVVLRLDDPLRYRPGQYASVRALYTDIPARCYSFAHAAPDAGSREISFFVRRVPGGAMSAWLLDTAARDQRVELHAALGDFHLREGRGRLLCVAGGSGLAPLLALLEGAAQGEGARRPVTVLMGARAQRDLYCQDALAALAARWQAPFESVPVLSEEPAASDWAGQRGWVTEAITAARCAGAQGYLCGPPPMIDAAIEVMTGHGLPRDHIFFDKFSDQSVK